MLWAYTFVNSALCGWRLPWECVLWALWTTAALPAMWPVHPVKTNHCMCSTQSINLSPSGLWIKRRKCWGRVGHFSLRSLLKSDFCLEGVYKHWLSYYTYKMRFIKVIIIKNNSNTFLNKVSSYLKSFPKVWGNNYKWYAVYTARKRFVFLCVDRACETV